MLKVPQTEVAFEWIKSPVEPVASATRAGTSSCSLCRGGTLPFDPKTPGSDFILAFRRCRSSLVMSVCLAFVLLGHHAAGGARLFLGAGKNASTSAAPPGCRPRLIIFVGQVEAPLFIRPTSPDFLGVRWFIVMTGGMAGHRPVTGFVLYATILPMRTPDAAGHIVVCSVLGAPCRRSSSAS